MKSCLKHLLGERLVDFLKNMRKNSTNCMRLITAIAFGLFDRKSAFVLATPKHSNLGDIAITIAEQKFLKEGLKLHPICIPDSFLFDPFWFKTLHLFIGKHTIFLHGGGFLGSIWPNMESIAISIIEDFPENRILIFPQTIYYDQSTESKQLYLRAKVAYSQHKNLHLLVREGASYQFAKTHFSSVFVHKSPDMVLYLDQLPTVENKTGVVFCFRRDKERMLLASEKDKIIHRIQEKFSKARMIYTDTVRQYPISSEKQGRQEVYKLLTLFSKSELVVTDRLHGMIFAYLAKTPCIVLPNSSGKIQGVYEYLQEVSYIRLISDFSQLEDALTSLSKSNGICEYEHQLFKNALKKAVVKGLKETNSEAR